MKALNKVMDKKVNKVMDKKEAGNIFISYTDKNKVLMLCRGGQLPQLTHLSNNKELSFHQQD